MEIINLKTLSKSITAAKLKQSLKIVIRDVDEISTNNFVAYADEKDDSFDVSIKLDNQKNVVDSDCDCEIKGLCIHRIAFLNFLSNGQEKTKTVREKKLSPTEILVNSLDANTLKIWVNALLKKNKDLNFLFVNEFTVNDIIDYTKPKVESIIKDSIKSVIKNKKNIDANELKKVLDLLDVTLKPVIDFALQDLADKEKLDLMFFIIEQMLEFNDRIYSTSVKIVRFNEKFLKLIADVIANNPDEIRYQKIIDLHFELLLNIEINGISQQNFNHLKQVYVTNLDNEFRKKYYAEKIQNLATGFSERKIRYGSEINIFMLEVLFENNFFKTTHQYFEGARYENVFNLSLIDKLISIGQIDKAEKIANAQVANNYYIDYNIPYWERLKSIYLAQNETKKLLDILINTVPINMNFEDFLFVKKNMPEADFKQYRITLMGRTKRNFSNKLASEFYFKLLADVDNYKKMLESISEDTDYDLIFDYKEQLFALDKILFLVSVCQIQNSNYYKKKVFSEEYRDKLSTWVIEYYDNGDLNRFIQTYMKRINSPFLNELAAKFQN